MKEISVITCAHNPRMDILHRVWHALGQQTLSQDQWDYILVDNASDEPLSKYLEQIHLPDVRCVHEPMPGLTRARLAGMAAAKGGIVVFVDDDCLLEPDYLENVLSIMREHPFLGAVGGYGRAEYEQPPPAWMDKGLRQYHLDFEPSEFGHSLLYARAERCWGPWIPVGAGLVMRRELADAYAADTRADPVALGLDRTGAQLFGGGDLDMSIHAIAQGYAVGKDRNLRFTHVVPSFRLELKYMIRLLYMSQYSTERLLIHRGWRSPVPLSSPSLWRRMKQRWKWLQRRQSPDVLCRQAFARGRADGLAGVPPDPPDSTFRF